jgi:hypothetical protein
VGIDSGSVFDRLTTDFAVPLEREDCLVLYTDGVTEALNSEGDEFGFDRMAQSVRASATDGAQAIVRRVIEDVRNFTGSLPQNDYITLIAISKTLKSLHLPNKTKKPNDRQRHLHLLHLPQRIEARRKTQLPACKAILTGFVISRCAVRPISRITKSALRAKKKRRSNTRIARYLSGWWQLLIILSLVWKLPKEKANSLQFILE